MRSLQALLAASLLIAPIAQARETGDIRGVIEDTDGLPVPGARLVLGGSELGGERSTLTDENGRFRFDGLAPGSYDLTVLFNDVVKLSAIVDVATETTTSVPLEIDLVGDAEVVDVVHVRPVVDATHSSVNHTLTADMLSRLPVARSYQDVVNTLPGIQGRVDTSSGGSGDGNPSVRGEGQYGNSFTIDGVQTRDPATKTFGQNVNFDAIEEIQVFTDGAPAEYGQFTGMALNVVTKDGGDEHHGSFGLFYSQHAWFKRQYDIYDPTTGADAPTDKAKAWLPNFALTAGGPIVKEKLWYFGALDFGFARAIPEGTTEASDNYGGSALIKLTWFPRNDLVIRYLYNHDFGFSFNEAASQLVQPEADTNRVDQSMTHLMTATWIPDERNELVARFGLTRIALDVSPVSGDQEAPSIIDSSGIRRNNATDFDFNRRLRVGGGLTYARTVPNAAGIHKIKLGAEYWWLRESRELRYTGLTETDWIDQNGVPDPERQGVSVGTEYLPNPDLGYNCTQPDGSDCGYRQHWINAGPLGTQSHTFQAFVQDDWAPVQNLHFNLGLRMDLEDGRGNTNERPTTQDPAEVTLPPEERTVGTLKPFALFSPRIGIVWDPTRDDKTKVSAHFGTYYDISGANFWSWSNANSADGYVRYARDEGGAWQWTNTQDPQAAPLIFGNQVRPARMDKVMVAFEREIIPLLSIGLRGILSRTQGIPEDVNVNLDDWYILNTPAKNRFYRALELSVQRKYDGVWQLFASYTLSESWGHAPGQFETASNADSGSDGNNVGVYLDDVGEEDARRSYYDNGLGWILEGFKGTGRYSVSDPEFNDDAGYYGYLPYHSFHSLKINGSYTMPWGTTLGLVYEFDSGHAWQKRTFVPFYGYDGLAQGRGTRFMPATHYLDFHIDHTFEFRRDQSLELALDVFNLPGFAQAITYFENDTVGFGSTLYRQAPRSIRATIKYRW